MAGGHRHALGGTFFEPTVLTGVTPAMMVAREETFGPVAPLFRFKSEQEAIAMANDTEFGLAAYMYTRDLARSWRVSEALEYGIVGLNTGLISTEVAPFGGVKESGTGREGSKYGLLDYTEIKYVCVGGVSASPTAESDAVHDSAASTLDDGHSYASRLCPCLKPARTIPCRKSATQRNPFVTQETDHEMHESRVGQRDVGARATCGARR